jgi:CBS domain-containing protein
MKLSEIMSRDVRCLPPDATLHEAAKLMAEGDFGAVPVCEDDHLAGMVTDRDIVVRGVATGAKPDQATLREVMSPRITFCFDDQSVEDAAQLMEERQIRRLPILSRDKRLIGIVSLGDIAVEFRRDALTGEVLERVSEPAHA